MFQAQIRLGSLPINLVLVGDSTWGEVVFVKVQEKIKTVFDEPEDTQAVMAVFTDVGFGLSTPNAADHFEYDTRYDYKNIPLMLKWLQQQKLQQPL